MNSLSLEERARIVLSKASKVVESTLTSFYGLPKIEADRFEEELSIWFDRLVRRPGTPSSLEALRLHLISMTCKVGHIYWMGKIPDEQPADERVKRALALGPEIIAIEIQSQLDRGDAEDSR